MASKVVPDIQNGSPDISIQGAEIRTLVQTRLKKGDLWYLVDVTWWNQWKKYVGFDQWDQSQRGLEEAHPGPVDNAELFKNKDLHSVVERSPVTVLDEVTYFKFLNQDVELREHLMDELDYYLLPVQAWNKLVEWYGLTPGSKPISKVVVEHGLYMKYCKVEVYPLEFKLCVHPHVDNIAKLGFSRGHTVEFLERVMRAVFNVSEEKECRVWHRYNTHTYELLSKPKQTFQDAILYKGRMIILEMRNKDGTWPRSETGQQSQKIQPPTTPRTVNEIIMILRGVDPQSVGQSDESRQIIASLQRTNNELNISVQESQCRATEAMREVTALERQLTQTQDHAHQEAIQTRSQLAVTQDQLLETQDQLAEADREANQTQCQLAEARREADQAQGQLAEARREITQTRSQLTQAQEDGTALQRQLEEVQAQLTEVRRQATQTQHQLTDAQRETEEAHQRADGIEHDLRDAEHRLSISDRVFQDVLQRIMGHIPQSQPFWVVQRAEVILTNEEIGTGGWASVKVAIFRGQRVAAKCLHQQIVSAHNVRLFTREMNMAAQSRHPNLLQFIGAVMEGTPVILTELLPTSLRRIMEQGTRLTRQQIVSIACDVARALNYLHLSTPDTIVHRDLSSANVLLEPNGENWKAKVSDYGSANFARYATTAGPGNPLYGAPEANDPSRHSPKMDVFSFGVMLVEMVAGELPDRREELIRTHMHNWPDMVRIVRGCTRREPDRRPSMNELITDLDRLNV